MNILFDRNKLFKSTQKFCFLVNNIFSEKKSPGYKMFDYNSVAVLQETQPITMMKIRFPFPVLSVINPLSLISKIYFFILPLLHIVVESEVSLRLLNVIAI